MTAARVTMTPRHVVRTAAVGVLVLAGTTLTGGTAYAFWSAGGSGTGRAAATTAQPLATATATVGGALLYPGATGDLALRVSNPNPFAVTVTAVTGNGAITSDKGTACDAATGVTLTDRTGLALVVPAGATQSFTLSGAVAMDNSSDTSCQGATFTVPVLLTGQT